MGEAIAAIRAGGRWLVSPRASLALPGLALLQQPRPSPTPFPHRGHKQSAQEIFLLLPMPSLLLAVPASFAVPAVKMPPGVLPYLAHKIKDTQLNWNFRQTMKNVLV